MKTNTVALSKPAEKSLPLGSLEFEIETGISFFFYASLAVNAAFILVTLYIGFSVQAMANNAAEIANIKWVMLALIALFASIIIYTLSYIWNAVKIQVFNNGLIYKQGTTNKTLFWKDIAEVWDKKIKTDLIEGVLEGQDYELIIASKTGDKISMYRYVTNEDKTKLSEKIHGEILKRKLPKYYQKLLNGEQINLDGVTLSKNNLVAGRKSYTLLEISDVMLGNREVKFKSVNDLFAKTLPSNDARLIYALLKKLGR